jgi:3-dehydroquinate dehydratase/shikimate dehydrogenase
MDALIEARDRSVADLVELRLDTVADPDVARALDSRRTAVVITCRPLWEGGAFRGSEEERCRLLKQALDGGAEFVDIEWLAGFEDLIRAAPSRVVISSHDFEGVPKDLHQRARAMRQTGAGLIKVAINPKRLEETLPLHEIARNNDAIVVGMGLRGLPTRLLSSWYGSHWTYAGENSELGQLSVAKMIDEYRFREVQGAALYGVVGNNVEESLSPAMHNAAFAASNEAAVYVPLPVEDFEDFSTFASTIGLQGASVTVPYKLEAYATASESDRCVRAIGAANTLDLRSEKWRATNTDAEGFMEPLGSVYPGKLHKSRVSVLGAGGAARAVVYAIREAGAKVTIHARRKSAAIALAEEFHVSAGDWPPAAASWDLLVNATPLGGEKFPDQSPMPSGPFDGKLVYDLVYRSGSSPLLEDAVAAGCRVVDGLPMLVAQAERQFEWWLGRRPETGVMQAAAETFKRA